MDYRELNARKVKDVLKGRNVQVVTKFPQGLDLNQDYLKGKGLSKANGIQKGQNEGKVTWKDKACSQPNTYFQTWTAAEGCAFKLLTVVADTTIPALLLRSKVFRGFTPKSRGAKPPFTR